MNIRDPRTRQQEHSAPVVVCGGGAAGVAASLAASRLGAPVYLIESSPQIGGTVAHSLIHTIAGLFDSRGRLINDGLVEELTARLQQSAPTVRPRQIGRTWVLNVDPLDYQAVIEGWVREERLITVLAETTVSSIVAEGGRITEIELQPRISRTGRTPAVGSVDSLERAGDAAFAGVRTLAPPQRAGRDTASSTGSAVRIAPRAVVDATGSAEVVRLVAPGLVCEDSRRAAGGLIFAMRGVASGALEFPKGIGIIRSLRAAALKGSLPADCGKTWIDSGVSDDEVYVKLFVPLRDGWREQKRRNEITQRALHMQASVVALLQTLPHFCDAWVSRTGRLGVRDGGRVLGEYCLSESDVRSARKFADAACRCCWPIEYWDPVDGVSIEYLPEDDYYEIPLRCLRLKGFSNLFAAGKCLSADHVAQASARVAGTCWAMGEAAAGMAVSLA